MEVTGSQRPRHRHFYLSWKLPLCYRAPAPQKRNFAKPHNTRPSQRDTSRASRQILFGYVRLYFTLSLPTSLFLRALHMSGEVNSGEFELVVKADSKGREHFLRPLRERSISLSVSTAHPCGVVTSSPPIDSLCLRCGARDSSRCPVGGRTIAES